MNLIHYTRWIRTAVLVGVIEAGAVLQGVHAAESDSSSEAAFLAGTRQLTFAGKRAGEGYFSADGSKLVFQSERDETNPFFQIFLLDLETGDLEQVSTGTGKTTCAWVHPDGSKVLFASTHEDPEAEAKQKEEIAFRESGQERRYSWDYDEHYDLFERDLETGALRNLTKTKGYDAEGAYSPDGKWIVFASNRSAYDGTASRDDWAKFKLNPSYLMDLYLMRADGSEVRRLTDAAGYDGGVFFNADGSRICWRRFSEDNATAEIHTMNVDGTDERQLTRLGAMSWAPFFHPSGEYLIFATNLQGFANFELYLVDAAGEREPVRVTFTDGFDGLPAFSPDGRHLAWTSNRTPDGKSQIFLADWNHEAALAAIQDAPPAGAGGEPGDPPAVAGATPQPGVETFDFSGLDDGLAIGDLRVHVEQLASERMEGRLTGTPGETMATEYVAQAFAAFGLEPGGDDGSWFQSFDFTSGVSLGEENSLTLNQNQRFDVGEDWQPLSFSTEGDLDGAPVVFAGYGLEAEEEASGPGGEKQPFYSSYVHLDVKDKWVMIFRYLPEAISPEARQRFAKYSSLRYKAMLARKKGARGIIVVSGPNAQVKRQLVPLTFDASLAGSGVGAISITDEVAQAILDAAGQDLDLKSLQDAHDTGEMQNGIQLDGARLSVKIDINEEMRAGRNVVGILRAAGDGDGRAVAIGAHVDHLGREGGANSRGTDDELNMIHFGADDNASGVAGLLELAQQFAAWQKSGRAKLTRDIVFAAWSGEEIGLLGSAHFAAKAAENLGENPHATLQDRYAAYLNMDMIGRFENALVVQGVGSSSLWPAEIERRNAPVGLPIVTSNDSYIPTDATSFYLKGVPVLSAFTGAHEDYHTPRDTADKIAYEPMEKIVRLMGLVARGLATSDTIPDYQAMEKPEEQGARGGLRAYLGTVPDYAQSDVSGVKLSGVAKNGPAEKAGVRGGDVVVGLAGQELKNIYDYTFVLGALKVGEEVEIVVLRGGERVPLKITPESRD